MSDRKPEEVALGTGLADRARRLLMGRGRQIDEAVEGETEVKPEPREPKPAPKKKKKKKTEKSKVDRDKAAKNRDRLMRDLDSRIAAARGANNMDLVNTYEARKKALAEL